MRILGIETSCDESAVSLIETAGSPKRPSVRILANVVSSQVKLHAKFGGVVPALAKREHQRNLVPVLLRALKETKLKNPNSEFRISRLRRARLPDGQGSGGQAKQFQNSEFKILNSILEREPDLFARMVPRVTSLGVPKIDAIAVTVGPGLAPALWVGVNFARALSFCWKKPLIPVNHLEGHITVNLLKQIDGSTKHQIPNTKRLGFGIWNLEFPAIALLVSGGHTELVLMQKRIGGYRVIGETRDDAAGEAFDKVAKMMHLGFPGGPIIARYALRGNAAAFPFPRPMMRDKNFDFSFSGLKTAVLYTLQRKKKFDAQMKRDVSASFQAAAVDVLVAKTVRAAKQYRAKTVMLGGGVAANTKLRHNLALAIKKLSPAPSTLFPFITLTGDNALMIALAGYFNRKKTISWKTLRADANLRLDAPRKRN